MTPETATTIQLISTGICIGACLPILINGFITIVAKPDKPESPQPEKAKLRGDNFIVCVCADCVHHVGYQCGIDRTYITSDGKCKSYVPRDSKIAKLRDCEIAR